MLGFRSILGFLRGLDSLIGIPRRIKIKLYFSYKEKYSFRYILNRYYFEYIFPENKKLTYITNRIHIEYTYPSNIQLKYNELNYE